jgi:hypothetical protein
MFKKIILAVAAAASIATFASGAAKADTSIDIGFGFGGFGPDFGYSEPYFPRHRPHHPRWDDARPVMDYGIDCGEGRNIVREAGFNRVRAFDCSAPTYGYKAWRDGDLFRVVVNYRGNIVSVRPIW